MQEPANHPIVLFDGVCNLCNTSVQFILKRDKQNKFRFGSLQGTTGNEYLKKFNLPQNHFNSFILVEGETFYTCSTAALRTLKILGGAWSLCYGFMVVPPFIRDGIYNWIARNRYHWFGKRSTCWVPTAALRERFLD
jgi:predicted DCC family thiol-disulfide oxidoreductase YuxK